MRVILASLLAGFLVSASVLAQTAAAPAGVVARLPDSQRLLSELTPLGAVTAGNGADIPPWRGGVRMPPPTALAGQSRVAVYADDPVVQVIDSSNWQSHRQYLAMGLQALFQNNPDFRIPLYPSRRTAAAPESVYDAIYRNSVRVETERGRLSGQYALGGIIFPLPKTAQERVWNHLSRWRGAGRQAVVEDWSPVADGWQRMRWQLTETHPFYLDPHQPLAVEPLFERRLQSEQGTIVELADTRTGVQRDMRGERAGDNSFPAVEDRDMFSGRPSDYVWTLLGSREMYVPYNQDPARLPDLLPGAHPPTATLRFEKHRVWLVDGVLRKSGTGLYQKRVFYIDEDSSAILMADLYDSDGRLWRFNMALPVCWYEIPALVSIAEISHDLLAGRYAVSGWPVGMDYGFAQTP